jgi:2,4-dienoyl-CoA reductase-like NADH-dependent reductase (Old Yellow Enzyme family)
MLIQAIIAHGYFLHATLTAATNNLPAPYSGSLENRMRLLLELTTLTRATMPQDMPLLVRVTGTDWMPEGSNAWDLAQCVQLSLALADVGVDFIDVSSGGLMAEQKIIAGPSYQAPFAEAVKKALVAAGKQHVMVGTVGMITSGMQAEGLLVDEKADAVLVARAFLKNPGLVWDWANELGVEVRQATQIGWGFGQRPTGGVRVKKAPSARG